VKLTLMGILRKGGSISCMEKIKREAEERVNKEIERLFLDRIKNIQDIGSKETGKLFNEMEEMEYFLRKKEVQSCPELKGTDFFDEIFFDKMKGAQKELEAMEVSGIRMVNKDYQDSSELSIRESQAAEHVSQKYLLIVPLAWFVLSVVLGQILCAFIQPPDFILFAFSSYGKHVKGYELFCMSMMLAILFMPLGGLILWHGFYKKFILPISAQSSIWPVILFAVIAMPFALETIFATTGLGGGGRGDLRKLMLLLFGWRGGVFINVIFLTFLVIIIMGLVKITRIARNV